MSKRQAAVRSSAEVRKHAPAGTAIAVATSAALLLGASLAAATVSGVMGISRTRSWIVTEGTVLLGNRITRKTGRRVRVTARERVRGRYSTGAAFG